jgi:hypothetical protein
LGYSKNEISIYEKDVQTFIENLIQKEQAEKYNTAYTRFLKEKTLFEMGFTIKNKRRGLQTLSSFL